MYKRQELISGQRTAGRTKEISRSPAQSQPVTAALVPAAMSFIQPVYTPICPTNPQVPIPEETGVPFIWSLNRQVAIGPVIADVRMGAILMRGFFTIFPIWSIEAVSYTHLDVYKRQV